VRTEAKAPRHLLRASIWVLGSELLGLGSSVPPLLAMSVRLKVATDLPQLPVTWPQNVDSVGPKGRVGQGRLSQLRHFSHWADLKLQSTGADSRQNDSGGAPCKAPSAGTDS
jgi:hypothetical protein